jgi:hypothetical protein
MKDNSLTIENLHNALDKIEIGHSLLLRVSHFSLIQAHNCIDMLGLKNIVCVKGATDDEMPPGYCAALDATVFFPWRIEDGNGKILYESDGRYDIMADRKRRSIHRFLVGGRIDSVEYCAGELEDIIIKSMIVSGMKIDFTVNGDEVAVKWGD